MRDRPLIYAGLLVFLVLFTYPVWHGVAAKSSNAEPDLKLPATEKECVAPREYMRTSHMDLLISWRDGKVRDHQLTYRSPSGRVFDVSLTQTCLGCHGKREQFCDRCHTYAAVSGPYCWDCHNDAPGGTSQPKAGGGASVALSHPTLNSTALRRTAANPAALPGRPQ